MTGEVLTMLDPGNVAAKAMAKIDRSRMQRQLRGGCPTLDLVTVALATMAEAAVDRHVHRERATPTPRRGRMQRTAFVPPHPRSIRGLHPSRFRTCSTMLSARTNSVKIHVWQGCSLLGGATTRCSLDRSVPFFFMGNGNGSPQLIM